MPSKSFITNTGRFALLSARFILPFIFTLFITVNCGAASSKAGRETLDFIESVTKAEGELFLAIDELIKGLDATEEERDEYGVTGYIVGSGVYIAKEYLSRAQDILGKSHPADGRTRKIKTLMAEGIEGYNRSIKVDLAVYEGVKEGGGLDFKKSDSLRELADRDIAKAIKEIIALMRSYPASYTKGRIEEMRKRYRIYSRANAWYRLAYEQEDINKKIEYYEKAIDADPEFLDAWASLGVTHLVNGDAVKAEKAFREAVELEPNDAEAWSNLGLALEIQKKYPKSIVAHQTAVRIEPDSPQKLFRLAVAYANSRKDEEAVQVCKRALSLNPPEVIKKELMEFMLMHYEGRKTYSDAVKLYQEYIKDKVYDLDITYKMARIFAKNGMYDEAMRISKELIKEGYSKKSWAYYLMGLINWKLYFIEEAISNFEEVLNITPHHFFAQSMLAYSYGLEGRYEDAVLQYEGLFRMQIMGFADVGDPSLKVVDVVKDIKMRTDEHAKSTFEQTDQGNTYKILYEGLIDLTFLGNTYGSMGKFESAARKKINAAHLFLGMAQEETGNTKSAVKNYKLYLAGENDPLFKERLTGYINSF